MVQHSTMFQANLTFLNSRPALPVLAQVALTAAVVITKWSLRHRTRKHLRHMTAEQLNDIGITARDAHYQATLPFWRP